MPRFHYRALEETSGREQSGEIEAPQMEQAVLKLRARRLHPFEVEPARMTASRLARLRGWGAWQSSWKRERLHFTRQLAALLRAGVPLITGLELMARQDHPAGWRKVLWRLTEALRNGRSFSEALVEQPGVVSECHLGILKAGEASGRLDQCLDRVTALKEKADKVRRRVLAALLYPAIVAGVAVAIVAALVVFVIPRFEAVFAGLLRGQPLPPLTRVVIGVSRSVSDHGWEIGLGLGSLALATGLVLGTPRGRRGRDRLLLALPVLGDLCLKAAIARFARTLGALLTAGVPILAALKIAEATAGNQCVADRLDEARRRVEAGEALSIPLAEARLFPPLMTGLIQVGEETGGLPEMLEHLADVYDAEVDRAAETFTAVLEPALIVAMAGVVGAVVAALLLPIVKVIQSMG